ncbi:ribosome silencing factor [Thermoproteota archaeon]
MKDQDQILVSLVKNIVEESNKKKADNILVYRLNDTTLADYIVIVSVSNRIHCKSMTDNIESCIQNYIKTNKSDELHQHPKIAGTAESGWIILDVNGVVVHVVLDEIREFYGLDEFLETKAIVYHL